MPADVGAAVGRRFAHLGRVQQVERDRRDRRQIVDVVRRIPAGPGVYNLALTHDGKRLIATNKRDQSASVIDVATGKELARIPTTRKIVNGVAVSDDDRYAFITIEGSGAQPGTLDVIDLRALAKVASIDLGAQAGGVDFWKSETPRPGMPR